VRTGPSNANDGSDRRRETAASDRIDRRTLLAGVGGASAAALAGCSLLSGDEDASTTEVDDETARELAERL